MDSRQACRHLGHQVARATKFCTAAPYLIIITTAVTIYYIQKYVAMRMREEAGISI